MESKRCPACKNENEEITKFCIKCEFPFNATDKEKSIHIGRFIGKKGIIVDADDAIIKSQNLLYLATGFFLLGIILNFSVLLNNLFALLFNVVVIAVIVVSGALLKKSSLLFLVIPLFVLLSIYISNYLYNPNTLMKGILFKCLILGSLVYSIYNYLASEKFKKKYNF